MLGVPMLVSLSTLEIDLAVIDVHPSLSERTAL